MICGTIHFECLYSESQATLVLDLSDDSSFEQEMTSSELDLQFGYSKYGYKILLNTYYNQQYRDTTVHSRYAIVPDVNYLSYNSIRVFWQSRIIVRSCFCVMINKIHKISIIDLPFPPIWKRRKI